MFRCLSPCCCFAIHYAYVVSFSFSTDFRVFWLNFTNFCLHIFHLQLSTQIKHQKKKCDFKWATYSRVAFSVDCWCKERRPTDGTTVYASNREHRTDKHTGYFLCVRAYTTLTHTHSLVHQCLLYNSNRRAFFSVFDFHAVFFKLFQFDFVFGFLHQNCILFSMRLFGLQTM